MMPIVRQVSLICTNPLKQFLLQSSNRVFRLPMATIDRDDDSTFKDTMMKYCKNWRLDIKLKGIVRIETTNHVSGYCLRCIYYGESVEMEAKE